MKSWMQGLRVPTNPPMAYFLPGGHLWASSFGRGFVDLLSCCLFEPLCVQPTVLGLRLGGFWDPWAQSRGCFRLGKALSGDFWACPLPHLFREPLLQGVRSAFLSISGSNLGARWDPNGSLLTCPCAIQFSNSCVVFWSRFRKGIWIAFVDILIHFGHHLRGSGKYFYRFGLQLGDPLGFQSEPANALTSHAQFLPLSSDTASGM